ncbi:MAG: lycopene cyclase [Flavobacterium sp.]|nr:lycopene cyclase [Flavobacterium sp.]
MKKDFDYIIAGSGCAGLSLAVRIAGSKELAGKKVLIVDKQPKNQNDRTWCFWEEGEGLFESIVHKSWQQIEVGNSFLRKQLDIRPYRYKLIRGIDFYDRCLKILKTNSNFSFEFGDIESVFQTGITLNGREISADYVFNSIWEKPELGKSQYWLLQHFEGIYIKTASSAFNPKKAMLMDFDTPQIDGTTFFYVLPFSETEALIEYTLFSPSLLNRKEYQSTLKNYIAKKLDIQDYEVVHSENGVIPMTNYKFPISESNIINIGTAGGMTKGSSGYTFQYIQKHSVALVDALSNGGSLEKASIVSKRHQFYDSVLLNILHNKTIPGDQIFMTLFKYNNAGKVFKFLDNETSLVEELNIISSLPTLPFSRAAIKQLFT